MDQDFNKREELKDRIILFLKENKKKIILSVIILIILSISIIFFNNYKQKEHEKFSEKYILAAFYLKNDNKEKAKALYEEIIFSTNRFYAILSLNTILEKKLENDQNKILKYFNILEDLNISKDQKDLLLFKKSLYLINNSRLEDGKKILEKLIENKSKIKILAEEIMNN